MYMHEYSIALRVHVHKNNKIQRQIVQNFSEILGKTENVSRSSSSEPLSQLQPILAQSILGYVDDSGLFKYRVLPFCMGRFLDYLQKSSTEMSNLAHEPLGFFVFYFTILEYY